MAKFNQKGQFVQNQYNAETINFREAQSQDAFVEQLKRLQSELQRAIESQAIGSEEALDAETCLKKAVSQAESPMPDKKTLVAHLRSVQELVDGVKSLTVAVRSAITAVAALF